VRLFAGNFENTDWTFFSDPKRPDPSFVARIFDGGSPLPRAADAEPTFL